MLVYLDGGQTSAAALCFDYETDAEEKFVNGFMELLVAHNGVLSLRFADSLEADCASELVGDSPDEEDDLSGG